METMEYNIVPSEKKDKNVFSCVSTSNLSSDFQLDLGWGSERIIPKNGFLPGRVDLDMCYLLKKKSF